jgi:hypothetical protein
MRRDTAGDGMIVVVVLEETPAGRDEHRPDRDRDDRDWDDRDWDDRKPGRPTHGIPPDVPALLHDRTLASSLAPHVAGQPADGSPAAVGAPTTAVWVDGGDEVVVHLDSLSMRILDGTVVASLDLESDQTGRAAVVIRIALADATGEAGLVAATDEVAGGHPLLAARWGRAVQDAVWSGLLALAQEHGTAHGEAPRGISAVAGALRLHLGAPITLAAEGAA